MLSHGPGFLTVFDKIIRYISYLMSVDKQCPHGVGHFPAVLAPVNVNPTVCRSRGKVGLCLTTIELLVYDIRRARTTASENLFEAQKVTD